MTKLDFRLRSSIWALSVSIPALIGSVPVLAQTPNVPSATPMEGVGEIIVTAQRREERLQDVPISVTAIGGKALAAMGIVGTTEITRAIPSVQLTQSGPSAIFFVRGVGNTSGSVGEEGANALYVDGVYLGDLTSAATKFNNIERVEVLKGPQGTLFGRNSSGGLINIITREPGDVVVASGKLGYGNYDTVQGQIYGATPLTDTVSIDLALTGKDQGNGFGRNFATGKTVQKGWYWGARSKVAFRPGERTKIVLSGDYYKDENDYQNGFNLFKGTTGFRGATYLGDYNLNTTDLAYARIEGWGTSLNVSHEFDFATLTSITGRRSIKVRSEFDADYTPTFLAHAIAPSRVKTFQQELRLASASTTPLSWQAGLFYYNAVANLDGFDVVTPARTTRIINRMETNSYAAFGELSYDISATTHLTVGGRYTRDKRDLMGSIAVLPGTTVTRPAPQSLSTGKVTYRVALRQDLSDDINVYASYNRGFKSGIFATTASPAEPPVKPQTIDAFEIGFKSQLFDNIVRLNVAGFKYKIEDYQVRGSPGPGQTLLLNAASVKVDGIEGELTIAPAKGLQVNLNATYLDSRFKSFPNALFNFQLPASCPAALAGSSSPAVIGAGPRTGGGINCVGDASGNRTPLSPKFASSVSLNYRLELGSQSWLAFNGLWNYSSKIFFEADNRLQQPARSVFSAAVEYRPNPAWGVELWVNNLTDKRYYYTGAAGTTADQGILAAPRTYGVNLVFDL
ncbi:iron complex outermembrane receptor protein [Novosphingobium chloroacetimidivorans]|uniref:Iron complex outermembrane receptor protein n=1 Tax=Novosphingobium chloroacetimidivorans TaxID=1428314 RepID=A0A7W7NYY4_9SPHN|nr:TonB-dependent receptor [Novosphingobium chloroacetimidivorans]MBB4860647.1 iron complex outermembrane receptor protein [Novosphingobium chloroacetimidivorans]